MKILFLTPYPLGQAPSQRFRFEQYLGLLTEKGFAFSCQSFWDEKTWAVLYKHGFFFQKSVGFLKGTINRLLILFHLVDVDFVFIHRECLPLGPPVVEWIIAKLLNKKMIYDFDDAIWLSNTSKENKIISFLKWHSKVEAICKWSYRISCGNSFLADYARSFNPNVVVNPTTIDTVGLHNPSLYSIKKKQSPIVIGWTGTQSTLVYIRSLIPILRKLGEKFSGGIRFLVIADTDPKLDLPFVDFVPWNNQSEMEDLVKMDIGIMPLTDDQWAKGKCGFKALQYMAFEIPAVASPVGVNTTIIENGVNGYLCKNETEWLECLEKLITNNALRNEIGIAGRKKVETNYSVSCNLSTFLSLFDLDKINSKAINKNGSSGIL